MTKPKPEPEKDPKTGRFVTGNIGGGRKKGSRAKLGEAFITDLQADWQEHGQEVIATVRAERPQDYLKVVASILPKEHVVHRPTDEMTDDELAERLAILEELIAFAGGVGSTARPTHEGSADKSKPQ